HSQIWPAELLGYAGKGSKGGELHKYGELNLPTEIVSSEFLTMSGSKFSSSKGVVIYVRISSRNSAQMHCVTSSLLQAQKTTTLTLPGMNSFAASTMSWLMAGATWSTVRFPWLIRTSVKSQSQQL